MKQKSNISLETYEIIKIFDLKPIIVPNNGEYFKFRIEIFKNSTCKKKFYVRVWRRETFLLKPSYPLYNKEQHESCDEEILIQDIIPYSLLPIISLASYLLLLHLNLA